MEILVPPRHSTASSDPRFVAVSRSLVMRFGSPISKTFDCPRFCVEQFTRALDLMNRSLAVGGQVDLAPPPTVITPVIAAPQPPVMAEPVVPHGFRELVEYRCSQLGILCVPLVNRFQAGRPIFRVGNVLSYFDRQVSF